MNDNLTITLELDPYAPIPAPNQDLSNWYLVGKIDSEEFRERLTNKAAANQEHPSFSTSVQKLRRRVLEYLDNLA